jgi:hypothetical protein
MAFTVPCIFQKRKKLLEVWRSIRRLIDKYAPNQTVMGGRKLPRCSRCVPALLASWENNTTGEPCWGITKDFSDNGLSLVLTKPFEQEKIVCGLWTGNPVFLSGIVRQVQPFGGGFWLAGVEFTELLANNQVPKLLPFAENLVPLPATNFLSNSFIDNLTSSLSQLQ